MILLLQHTVRDYDAWKPFFDQHEGVRIKYGCLGHTTYRAMDKPNDLTLLLRWESRERAEEFLQDPSLAEVMQRGGVIGEPHATWVEKADNVTYAERQAA